MQKNKKVVDKANVIVYTLFRLQKKKEGISKMENQKKSTMVLQIIGFSLFYTLFVIAGISLSLTLFQSTNILLKLSGLSLFALSVVVLLLLISELYEICRKYARWRKLKKQLSQELSKIIQEYVDSETENC